MNNKRVLLAGIVLVLLFVGLWASPRKDAGIGPGVGAPGHQPVPVGPAASPITAMDSPLDALEPGYSRAFAGAVGAFDCGSGTYIGAIEPGRGYNFVADLGDGRVQLDIQGSGELCVLASELLR